MKSYKKPKTLTTPLIHMKKYLIQNNKTNRKLEKQKPKGKQDLVIKMNGKIRGTKIEGEKRATYCNISRRLTWKRSKARSDRARREDHRVTSFAPLCNYKTFGFAAIKSKVVGDRFLRYGINEGNNSEVSPTIKTREK